MIRTGFDFAYALRVSFVAAGGDASPMSRVGRALLLLELPVSAPVPPPPPAENRPVATPDAVVQGFRTGHSACEAVYARGVELASTASTGLAQATRLSGGRRIVTTGTLTRDGQEWKYSASPRDRL